MEKTISHRHVLHFVWQQTEGHRARAVGIVLLSIMMTALSLAQPLFFKQAIDAISKSDHTSLPVYYFALFMLLSGTACVAVAIILEQVSRLQLGHMEVDAMERVYHRGFEKVQRLSTDFHVNAFAGSTARKISRGVDAMETILDRIILNFLPAIAIVIGFIIVLGYYAPSIAVLITLGIIVYTIFSIWTNVFMIRFHQKVEDQDSLVMGNMVDTITGNPVVKSFAAEHREDLRQDALVREWKRLLFRAWIFSTLFVSAQYFILIILEVGIMILSLNLWRAGVFTAGSFIVMIVYIWQLWSKL